MSVDLCHGDVAAVTATTSAIVVANDDPLIKLADILHSELLMVHMDGCHIAVSM